jgi:hypothetical protein
MRMSERDGQRAQPCAMLTFVFASTSAPFASSALTTSKWHFKEARWSGVDPFCGAGEHRGQRRAHTHTLASTHECMHSLTLPIAHTYMHALRYTCYTHTNIHRYAFVCTSAPIARMRVRLRARARRTRTLLCSLHAMMLSDYHFDISVRPSIYLSV